MDHSLVIPINEITILMAISSIGIIAVLGQCMMLFVLALKKGN
ncbi:MAG: hypothetical protein ACKOXT_05940 [Actinomycetota bacterium]